MYSTIEVIQMLVNYGNKTMELLKDNKEFVINHDSEKVECWRRKKIFKDELLSSYNFDYIIAEAGGILK